MNISAKFSIASLSALIVCAAASAQQFTVETGKTKPLKLKQTAGSVVLGNPNVADVAVHSENMLFISGKTFGTTNLIVFDSEGETIYSANIVVTTNTANMVSVNRAGANFTYDCAPACRPGLSIGDDEGHYNQIYTQMEQQRELSE